MNRRKTCILPVFILLLFIAISCTPVDDGNKNDGDSSNLRLEQASGSGEPMNVVFILSDDHRYDFMGFMDKVSYLETPNMDRMARGGAHLLNAFVTTSLCSPSRASILTGQYTHRHGVVDNQSSVPDSAMFFPQYLQKGGYETGFVGKWHMGHHNAEPHKGFDYWASFKGQGVYYNPTLNENGKEIAYGDSTYITSLLTDKAVEFLDGRNKDKPFFLYLSHKAVHSEFAPARQDSGTYADEPVNYPKTMFPPGYDLAKAEGKGFNPQAGDIPSADEYNYENVPNWVKAQRNSWHGVDYMYHGQIKFDQFYHRYLETLKGIDRSIGRVLDYLEANDLMENTAVFYMGDNGFSFGEHGLIDKRQAYEESIRVPLLVYAPSMIKDGSKIEPMVQNIDIAPTILELAGLQKTNAMDGASFVPMLRGEEMPDWRKRIYYEYFWERPFPQTPTIHAVRTDTFKYIRYYGVWDINELYNLQQDPDESNNLIRNEEYRKLLGQLNEDIFDWLQRTNGMKIPLKPDQGARFDSKYRDTY
jgi:arylsulfatase A-like enzyme